MIATAKKPVIYSGGGVNQNNASEELTALAKLLNFPVTNTLMGLGAFPGSDRNLWECWYAWNLSSKYGYA